MPNTPVTGGSSPPAASAHQAPRANTPSLAGAVSSTGRAGGCARPIGLGFRVPMIVVSPWSFGGYVCSDLFDHSSLLRFLETRFGVPEPNISDWRRRICGDLTSTLRLHEFDGAMARLPDASSLAARQFRQAPQLPTSEASDAQSMPRQEPGTRPRVPAAAPAANVPSTRP